MFLSHLLICIWGIISSKESPRWCPIQSILWTPDPSGTENQNKWKPSLEKTLSYGSPEAPHFTPPHPKSKPTDDNSCRNNQNTLSHLHGADEADASPREECSMLPLNLAGSTQSAV